MLILKTSAGDEPWQSVEWRSRSTSAWKDSSLKWPMSRAGHKTRLTHWRWSDCQMFVS